ncbi:Cdc7p-Dbf4p kinase complex regulatory subunit [Stygiomarasmius scandens]|uniref:Cdc7p-Dbf4p kinase complex regulatory subunit n=1 Tax=Marasmiellus scandens TaxID=2682957 RepID=A0ABR1K848_9AGAR
MATQPRRPLIRSVRPQNSPLRSLRSTGTKRARSPAPDDTHDGPSLATKRVRAADTSQHKHKSRADKLQQELEFRQKYTRSMPSWIFHFDPSINNVAMNKLGERINRLGGTIDDFFSKEITHLIVKDIEAAQSKPVDVSDKENRFGTAPGSSRQISLRKSPSKQAAQQLTEDGPSSFEKAKAWGLKIWDVKKLDSVLSRCLDQPTLFQSAAATTSKTVTAVSNSNLTRLLQNERIHGTTERDPTQKRHDYVYFSKGSYFLLVEDMRGELATIAAHEYPVPKRNASKMPWPVLHCDPRSRGPFIPFDEKEKKRWEKLQQAEKELKRDQAEEHRKKLRRFEEVVRRKEAQQETKRGGGDLRRSVSMINLQRRDCVEGFFDAQDHDVEASNFDSANASGYLASGTGAYMAASGNSIAITSTTGTTSTSNNPSRRSLPTALRSLASQEVVTSRKAGGQKGSLMGPPPVPERQALLKKSKSTNTLRLSKREEGSKPGYCESCRMKFDDFKQHIKSSRHRKFAINDANFYQLDVVLDRIKRKTRTEVQIGRTGEESSEQQGQGWDSDSEQCVDDILPNLADDSSTNDVEMEDEEMVDLDD